MLRTQKLRRSTTVQRTTTGRMTIGSTSGVIARLSTPAEVGVGRWQGSRKTRSQPRTSTPTVTVRTGPEVTVVKSSIPPETGVVAMEQLPLMLTVEEAAEVLRIGRNGAYAAVADGAIPAVRIGRSIRIPRQALAVLLGLVPDPAQSIGTRNPPQPPPVEGTDLSTPSVAYP
jgi:excisionase family DNA binding protein